MKCQGHQTVTRARKGKDGKGISSTTAYYGLSASSSVKPTSWVAGTPPLMTQTNKYLWSYTRTDYSDGTHTETTPAIVGVFGDSGLSYRYSKWDEGFEYRNDNNPFYRDSNGRGIVDVVFADDITIWDPATDPNNPPSAWICRTTHTSSSSKPLPAAASSNLYWTAMNSTAPILTALVLARKIKADEIDVDTLYVKHLDAADGKFTGDFDANAARTDEFDNIYHHYLILNPQILRINANSDMGQGEFVQIAPLADPDRIDRQGLVQIEASRSRTCALAITGGYVQGLRTGIQKVTGSSSNIVSINNNIIVLSSSAVTLTLPYISDYVEGMRFKILNMTGVAITLKEYNNYSRIRVKGDSKSTISYFNSVSFTASVNSLDVICDGTYWYVVTNNS